MFLTKKEEQMCDGEFGETIRKSMDILVALGDIYGAAKLVDITSAQVSGVSYKTIGDAGLEQLEDLARDGSAKATINASLNPPGTDLDNWKELGFPEEFAVKQNQIVDAYANLGIYKTCTCTPYLVGNVPRFEDHVSWSESSAVAFVNSVIGARTNREGGPAALAAAIEMGIAGTFPMNIGIPSMLLYHLFIGIIEAVLTVIVLAALDKFRTDLLGWNKIGGSE